MSPLHNFPIYLNPLLLLLPPISFIIQIPSLFLLHFSPNLLLMASISTAAIIGRVDSSSSSWIHQRNRSNKNRHRSSRNQVRVSCSSSYMAVDPYQTLRIQPGASESEVKKAFRQLALQYHPDVCRGSNCGVQFHQITEAYDTVMNNLRGVSMAIEKKETYDEGIHEPMRGRYDSDWELWEEWMGWEGAGIRDYSSHINPYI